MPGFIWHTIRTQSRYFLRVLDGRLVAPMSYSPPSTKQFEQGTGILRFFLWTVRVMEDIFLQRAVLHLPAENLIYSAMRGMQNIILKQE